jgi:hypothetical protein
VSEEGAYCAFCIAFQDQSDAKQNTEFVQVPFHDWKNTMVLHQKDYYDTSMQGNILSLSIVLFLNYKRYYYLVLLLMLMEYMVIR